METLETIKHANGTLRVRIATDDEPYDTGDLFTRAGVKGSNLDHLTDVQLKERERAFLKRLYDNGGPWGYVVERECPKCGNWEHVYFCFGFDGDDCGFAREEGIAAMEFAAKQASAA